MGNGWQIGPYGGQNTNGFGFGFWGGGGDIFGQLFMKTLWDMKSFNFSPTMFNFGNMPMQAWDGNSFNWNTQPSDSHSSTQTKEEYLKSQADRRKFNTLNKIIRDYCESLKNNNNTTKYENIYYDMNHLGKTQEEKYTALKKIYNDNKTDIENFIKKTDSYKKSALDSNENTIKNGVKTITDYLIKPDGDFTAPDVDILDLFSNGTYDKKSLLKRCYDQKTNSQANSTKIDTVITKLQEKLVEKADAICKLNTISEDTKTKIKDQKEKAKTATGDDARKAYEKLYMLLRLAQAEDIDAIYKDLNEDFKDDPILGANAARNAVKADLINEGFSASTPELA